MKRLNRKGETIVETLVAILIVAVCLLMLSNSIVSAAKINKKSEEENIPFLVDGATKANCSLKVSRNGSSTIISGYTCKVTKGGYYYYEKD